MGLLCCNQHSHYYLVLSLISVLFDIYTLARIFTKFDLGKMIRGPIRCRNNQTVQYGIIYVGKSHAEIYLEFLLLYFGKDEDIIYDEDLPFVVFDEPFYFYQS